MLGDCTSIKDEGKGTIPILTKKNQNKYIPDVYYVPQLKHNLLSVGQLMEHGYAVLFQKNTCYIYDKHPHKSLIAKVEKTKSRMFPLTLRSQNTNQYLVHNISRIDEIHLLHSRYGHILVKSLSLLQKKSIVIGLPTISEKFCNCEICVLSKHKRDSFPSSTSRAKEPLALFHTDICGPM